MIFKKDLGNWKNYESMKTDDFSVNKKYWKKYNGISESLAQEIPTEKLCLIADNYVSWIGGESFDNELHQKLQSVPEVLRFAYLVYNFECEINNGGFDQFYFNSIGYEVFEIQMALEFFGLVENKKILDKSVELLKQKIDIEKYYELSASRDLPTEDLEDEFSELDNEFYEYPEDIENAINSYLDKHRKDMVTV